MGSNINEKQHIKQAIESYVLASFANFPSSIRSSIEIVPSLRQFCTEGQQTPG